MKPGTFVAKNASNNPSAISGRKPALPSALLRQMLEDQGKTQRQLANILDVSLLTINQLLNGHRGVSAAMALRLAKAVRGSSPKFWLDLQQQVDLYEAQEAVGDLSGIGILLDLDVSDEA